jgi:hypothetical protein
MRLIRLTTNDEAGFFDNQFNSEISIKSGDSIALQSASFSNQINTLDIDATNDEIKFQISAGNEKTIHITHGLYTNENVGDLFDEIELKLNNSVGLTAGKELGLQAVCENTTDKIDIGFFRSPLSTVSKLQTAGFVEFKTTEFSSSKLSAEAGQASRTDDRYKFFQTIPFGFGSKVFRVKLKNYVDTGTGNEDNGFVMGLSEIAPNLWENEDVMTDEQKTYYIRFSREGSNYLIKSKGGNETDSGEVAFRATGDEADHLELCINQGRLQGRIYKSNPDSTHLILDVPYDNKTVLYPFITFQGSKNNIRVGSVRINHNAFIALNRNNKSVDTDNSFEVLTANNPPSGAGAIDTVNILTLSPSLASFFGFNLNSTTATLGQRAIFRADEEFRATLSNTSFMVLLSNVNIDSHNGASGNRENILAVIPQQVDKSLEIVEYETKNLYFIDIKEDFNLKNIRARLLRIDGSPCILKGQSILTLLIKRN